MRIKYALAFLLILGVAGIAEAFPRIVIYEYNPAAPTLELVSQKPADHQSFTTSPEAVILIFSVPILEEDSFIKVFDPYNNPVKITKSMPKDSVMSASLPARLYAGGYRIEWKASCACSAHTVITGTSYFAVY